MRHQPVLETERLRLRRFEPADAARVQELAGDARIADVTANIPHPYLDGVAEAWISTHPRLWGSGTGVVYALTLRSASTLIGAASVLDIVDGEGELGFWVGVPFWRRGYCTEAVLEILRSLGEGDVLRRARARHLTRNPASGRVLVKAGFVHTGRTESACGYRHERESVEVYSLRLNGGRPASRE